MLCSQAFIQAPPKHLCPKAEAASVKAGVTLIPALLLNALCSFLYVQGFFLLTRSTSLLGGWVYTPEFKCPSEG